MRDESAQAGRKQTDEHLTLIGHDARKTSVRMSQTCAAIRRTGDVCEMVYGFDVWLTSDAIAGSEDRHAFEQAYLRKMGLDQLNPATQGAVWRFMGQYSDMLKTLAGKAGDFNSYAAYPIQQSADKSKRHPA